MGSCFKWKRKQSYDVSQPDSEYSRAQGKYRTSQLGGPVVGGFASASASSGELNGHQEAQLRKGNLHSYDNAPTLEKRQSRTLPENEEPTTEVFFKRADNVSDVEEIDFALRQPEAEQEEIRAALPEAEVDFAEDSDDIDARGDMEEHHNLREPQEVELDTRTEEADVDRPTTRYENEEHAIGLSVTASEEMTPENVPSDVIVAEQVAEAATDDSRSQASEDEDCFVVSQSHVTYNSEPVAREEIEREAEETEVQATTVTTTSTAVSFSGHADIHSNRSSDGEDQATETHQEEVSEEPVVFQAREPRAVSFAAPEDLEERFSDSPSGTWDARLNSEVRAEYEARQGSNSSLSSAERDEYPHDPHHHDYHEERVDYGAEEDDHHATPYDDSDAAGADVSVVTVTTSAYAVGDEGGGDPQPSSASNTGEIHAYKSLLDEMDDNQANERIVTTRTEYRDVEEIELSGDTVQYVS